jgi:hypothetical protein
MAKFKTGIIAAFLLLAIGTALAASNSTDVSFTNPTSLAGNKIAPGTYKLSWTGEGDNLTVTLKSGKTEVKAPAKMVKNDSPMSYTSFVTNKDGELLEIRPAGKKTTIQFTDAQSASTNPANSASSNR